MEKIIKVTVANEEDALKVSKILSQLNKSGELSLGESIIMSKDESGHTYLKNLKGEPTSYTLTGAIAGSLMGIFAGPLGMLWGAAIGSLAGAAGDMFKGDRIEEILEVIGKRIPAGKTVVIAHVDEQSVEPLDKAVIPFNATVGRLSVDDEIEVSIQKKVDLLDDDIENLTLKLEQTAGTAKAFVAGKLEELIERREELQELMIEKTLAQTKQYAIWLEKVKNDLAETEEGAVTVVDENRKEHLTQQLTRQEEKLRSLTDKMNEL
ncbi:DUF1269 domain-containing protein [Pedobacter sp.]|uniref:DUF1269 domain-containing protein n=1 Tax=Pedobacter sp. TaxID=1411316 RepID=UPI003D7FF210